MKLALSTLLVVALASPHCRPSTGCPSGEASCFCAQGASCTHRCAPTSPGCALHCANQNQSCSLTAGDHSSGLCQGARLCDVTVGRDSLVACQYVRDACRATVGDKSTVRCEGAAACDVTCTGACQVGCESGGRCKVRCADPSSCDVRCGGPAPARLCPDAHTKVCGAPC